MDPVGPTHHVLPDRDTVATEVAAALEQAVGEAVAARGRADVALTGGSLGSRVVGALADRGPDPGVWSAVHLWWGDERFVPAGHADRNDQQAADAGLDRLGVPPGQVHRVPAGDAAPALDVAAGAYAGELAAHARPGEQVPRFDVMLLGVGPDSHVASLFPGRPELLVTDRSTVPVTDSPKPPPLRVSLTVPALRAAERVWFVVAGEDKAQAVRRAHEVTDEPDVPVSWVRGRRETVWWLDRGAAAGLPGG
jgi:6-phosphogluconolactonase